MALLGTVSLKAQTYQELNRFELGLNIGAATTSLPKESLYRGTSTYYEPFMGLRALYTIKEYFQVGFEVNNTKWSTTDDNVPITGLYNQPVRTDTLTYVFAKNAVSFLFHANAIIPLFRNYRYDNVANVHLGISGGPVKTFNDGAITTKDYTNTNNDSTTLTYMSQYNFQRGSGWAFGFQVGYTHYIKDHVGIGVEYAPRFYRVRTWDATMAGRNSEFTLWAHAISLSIRYRW